MCRVFVIWWLKISTRGIFLGLNHYIGQTIQVDLGYLAEETVCEWERSANELKLQTKYRPYATLPGSRWLLIRGEHEKLKGSVLIKGMGRPPGALSKGQVSRHLGKVVVWVLLFKKITLALVGRLLKGNKFPGQDVVGVCTKQRERVEEKNTQTHWWTVEMDVGVAGKRGSLASASALSVGVR